MRPFWSSGTYGPGRNVLRRLRMRPHDFLSAIAQPALSQRRLLLLIVGGALFLWGQFEEPVFALLTSGWHMVFSWVGQPAWGAARHAAVPGLTTHGLPVAMSYRVLSCSLSVLLLHLLLRGHRIRWIAGFYSVALVASMLLLLLGREANLPFATQQGHGLLDLICSPVAVLLTYVCLALRPPMPLQTDRPTQEASPTRVASAAS